MVDHQWNLEREDPFQINIYHCWIDTMFVFLLIYLKGIIMLINVHIGVQHVNVCMKNSVVHRMSCVQYLSSSILEDQMLDAGLDCDVGSDQQLQSTDCWELLRDTETGTTVWKLGILQVVNRSLCCLRILYFLKTESPFCWCPVSDHL